MSSIVTIGLNHRTAPLGLREKAAFTPETLVPALQGLATSGVHGGGAVEALILSTCNRTELYCRCEDAADPRPVQWLARTCHLIPESLTPHLYVHAQNLAVRHAFRVASGLDSMVLGEPQILGQMKDAFATAHKLGVTGKILNRLFQQTFAVAKQVRTDTAIGASAVSVASAAVSLARRIFTSLTEKRVLLIGAGETIELVALHLREQGVRGMLIANRTIERAERLAATCHGQAITLAEIPARLPEADIVFSSTASQLPILGKGAVERALKIRRHRPMFLVDLAVPRDIEPEVGELADIYLYSVDDIETVVSENRAARAAAAADAELIIEERVAEFMQWVHSLDVLPTLRTLRDTVERSSEQELERARLRLKAGEDPEQVLAQMARALTNKFLHAPSAALKAADHEGDANLSRAATRLFGLDDE